MYREHIIHIPLYRYQITVIDTDSTEQVYGLYEIELEEIFADCQRKDYKDIEENKFYDNCFLIFNSTKIGVGEVVHECLHAMNYLYEDRGIKYDLDNDEYSCYLLQYIVQEVSNFLNDKSK